MARLPIIWRILPANPMGLLSGSNSYMARPYFRLTTQNRASRATAAQRAMPHVGMVRLSLPRKSRIYTYRGAELLMGAEGELDIFIRRPKSDNT